MNKPETQSAKLLRTINELEHQAEIEKNNFIEGYHQLLESMKAGNLLKMAFEKIKESPKVRARVIAGVLGFALSVAAKKMISKKLHVPWNGREKERVTQAIPIVATVSKVLKPVLSIMAARILSNRKRKHEKQLF